MHDKISINDLQVSCIIGVFDHERKTKQTVIVNIELHLDLHKAGQSDDIKDTVSYYDIVVELTDKVESSQFQLLEALAEMIAQICLQDKRVKHAHVKVEKPNALQNAKSSAIEITRKNDK